MNKLSKRIWDIQASMNTRKNYQPPNGFNHCFRIFIANFREGFLFLHSVAFCLIICIRSTGSYCFDLPLHILTRLNFLSSSNFKGSLFWGSKKRVRTCQTAIYRDDEMLVTLYRYIGICVMYIVGASLKNCTTICTVCMYIYIYTY